MGWKWSSFRTLTPTRRDRSAEQWLFAASLVVLAGLSFWPIWKLRLLPMQDYPQHLFLSRILATFNDPNLDWKKHYEVSLGLRPYMLWYLLAKPLALAFGVDAAGRILFSGYIALVTALVMGARRFTLPDHAPWAALLLFPLAFNQCYFMGLSNYILSIPILFLALVNLERIARGEASTGRFLLQAGYLAILLLDHPYSVLTYIGLSVAGVLTLLKDRAALWRTLAPSLGVAGVWIFWFVAVHNTAHETLPWRVTWWPLWYTAEYCLLMFTGMIWHPHVNGWVVAIWLLAAAGLGRAIWRWRETGKPLRWPLFMLGAAVLATLSLPFWAGYYSYFNVRMAPVAYFAGALLLARLRVGPRAGLLVTLCAAVLVGMSIDLQGKVSAEAEEVLGVCDHVRKNALILSLPFNSTSNYLDKDFFYQAHSHEVSYCHLVAGGGADADLFPSVILPVQYKPGAVFPAPDNLREFESGRYLPHFDYLLTRGAPLSFAVEMASQMDFVAESGHWLLFRNRHPVSP